MKHRRGIDLEATKIESELAFRSVDRLREWHMLGGRCMRCEREGWVDRYDIERRFGRQRPLAEIAPLLRCRKCGNKGNNRWIFGTMPR